MAARQFRSESFRAPGTAPEPLDRVLRSHFGEVSWGEVRRLIDSGKVWVEGERLLDARALVAPGAEVRLQMNAPRDKPGGVPRDAFVVYRDRHVVVAKKRAGVSSIPHEGEDVSTELEVRRWLEADEGRACPPLGVVHRLDKVTSGLILFARTQPAKLLLKEQFRAHSVGRYYLAVAQGQVQDQKLEFRLTRDRGDGLRGVTRDPRFGRYSATHVRVLERYEDCCLVQCRLETGRTHQIRIHLAEIGHPLVGEPLYTKGFSGPLLSAPRVMLHAAHLSFEHPAHRGHLSFEEPLPQEIQAWLDRRRRI